MPVEHDNKGTYIFSSKDLCLINEIPEIINMGVESLKIEGRLKTDYYLASIINIYRNAIDDYIENPTNFNAKVYENEILKTKTRGLSAFYFNDRNNQDIQDYKNEQMNLEYEYGAKVVGKENEYTILEIRNRLVLGDEMEAIIPNKLLPMAFTIENMYDIDNGKEIEFINPGKANQKVKMKLVFDLDKNIIIRRKK